MAVTRGAAMMQSWVSRLVRSAMARACHVEDACGSPEQEEEAGHPDVPQAGVMAATGHLQAATV